MNQLRTKQNGTFCLTQHALFIRSVGVPGADSVLDQRRDVVGHHIVHSVVHGGSGICLSSSGSTNDIPHLRHAIHISVCSEEYRYDINGGFTV